MRDADKTMAPRVSVIIPCYNLGAYLEAAISSVLAQTFTDFDILVVDDGSTDADTREALARVEAAGTRVLRTPNRGLSAARNAGIAATTGGYLCCLDADDRLHPSWLGRAMALLDGEPDLAFASHWLRTFGDEEWSWEPQRSDLGALLDVNTVNGAAVLRRDVALAVGGFDESMRDGCEDWEFWIRVVDAGYRGAIIPERLYEYRRRSDSMSRVMNSDETMLRLYGALIERHPLAYRAYLLDLTLRRDATIADLHRSIEAIETELAVTLEPALAERRAECDRARARLAALRRLRASDDGSAREEARHREWQIEELQRKAAWLESERDAVLKERDDLRDAMASGDARHERTLRELHGSWSWRLTAPLRAAGKWWTRG